MKNWIKLVYQTVQFPISTKYGIFLSKISIYFQKCHVFFGYKTRYSRLDRILVLRKSGQFSITMSLMFFQKLHFFLMRKWPFLNMFLIGFHCMLSLVSSCLSFLSIFEKNVSKWKKIHIFEKISISSRDIHLNYIFRNRSRRAKIGFFYLDTLSFNSFQTT